MSLKPVQIGFNNGHYYYNLCYDSNIDGTWFSMNSSNTGIFSVLSNPSTTFIRLKRPFAIRVTQKTNAFIELNDYF